MRGSTNVSETVQKGGLPKDRRQYLGVGAAVAVLVAAAFREQLFMQRMYSGTPLTQANPHKIVP